MSKEDAHSLDGFDQRFMRYVQAQTGIGDLDEPDGRAEMVGSCGDSIEVQVKVVDGILSEVRAVPRGCVYTVACAGAVSGLARGLSLEAALNLEPEDVSRELGGLPEDHLHCARLAVNTLGEALAAVCGGAIERRSVRI